ncbi:meiotic recombination protein REC8 homolog [Apteryx mantelli]|uniref:Meiotic recombination protein REC8 homolog n=1 Tax=Apteryx mantelli TaxID=2696672 RepID=A0ABM4G1I2_9AVES
MPLLHGVGGAGGGYGPAPLRVAPPPTRLAPPPPRAQVELPEVTPRELELLVEAEAELLPPGAPPPPPPPPPSTSSPSCRPRRCERNCCSPRPTAAPRCCWSLPPRGAGAPRSCCEPRPAVPREALEPSIPALPISEISLEVPEEELRPRLPPPEELRPPVPPAPPVLPEVPEWPEPELPPAPPAPSTAELRRLVLAELRRTGGTDFASLPPPGATRILVSRLFSLLLELCGAGVVRLEQARPYGPVAVGLGPRFPPSPTAAAAP